jgi:RNA polymerase sigma factor (sigma-70 family)
LSETEDAMPETPETRRSLLVRLRDPADRAAWEDFVSLYGPLAYRYARKRGLQDADAADVTQNVLQAVAKSLRSFNYDPALGRFRSWLFEIVRRQLAKWQRTRSRHEAALGGNGDGLEHLPAPDSEETDLWEREYQQQRFLWAAQRVEAHVDAAVWQAFWRTAVDSQKADAVAADLGISVGAVYTAKSRVLARIRQEVRVCEDV